jgi:cytoskeletal protein RodZ
MFKPLKNQRGAALALELVLVAAVVVFAGLGVWRYFQETNHTPTASSSGTQTGSAVSGSTVANGTVNDAVNAVNAEANAEAQDSAQEGTSLQSIDSTSAAAAGVTGAYNENSF